MKTYGTLPITLLAGSLTLGLLTVRGSAQGAKETPAGTPDATINLMTREGVDQVKGQWRYSDVKIIEVDNQGKKTYDYTPHADQVARPEFDDAGWETLDPT